MLAADLAERDRVVAADHATIQSLCGSVVDLQKHKFVLKFQTEVYLHHLLGLSLWYKACTCSMKRVNMYLYMTQYVEQDIWNAIAQELAALVGPYEAHIERITTLLDVQGNELRQAAQRAEVLPWHCRSPRLLCQHKPDLRRTSSGP